LSFTVSSYDKTNFVAFGNFLLLHQTKHTKNAGKFHKNRFHRVGGEWYDVGPGGEQMEGGEEGVEGQQSTGGPMGFAAGLMMKAREPNQYYSAIISTIMWGFQVGGGGVWSYMVFPFLH
jgi:hypothetical protein